MKQRTQGAVWSGFALPTVLIASVVMLAVLSASVAAATSTRAALLNQYYDSLATDAAESGMQMARECIEAGFTTWSDPLRTGGTCAGLASACSSASCYLVNETNIRTSFEVSPPTVDGDISTVKSKGITEQLRTTGGGVTRSYSNTISRLEAAPSAPLMLQWRSLAIGEQHSCSLASDTQAYCWGYNLYGRLGDGTTSQQLTPTLVSQGEVPSGVSFTQIATGAHHSCAIGSNAQAYCWGYNSNGQLGDGSTTSRSTPVAVSAGEIPSGVVPIQIAVGTSFTCIVASDYKVYCWGINTNGRLGDGTTTQRTTPVAVSQGAVPSGVTLQSITIQNGFTCGLGSDHKAYCWGANTYGALGDNSTTSRSTPVAVQTGEIPSGVTFLQLSAGHSHTCGLGSDYKVYCWGYNSNGRLGDGTTTNRRTPVDVSQGSIPVGTAVKEVASGETHTCALGANDRVYCWGYNLNGQLGTGNTSTYSSPATAALGEIPSGTKLTNLYAGSARTCVLGANTMLYCWGINTNGRLGDGTTTQRLTAVPISPVNNTSERPLFASVSVYYLHTCATGTDSKAYCWGYSNNGRLGDGTTTQHTVPVGVVQGAMPTDAMISQVSVGWVNSCAIASDGWSYCWGANSDRQFGNGTTTSSNTATPTSQGEIPAGATIRKMTSGQYHTCAIASDNKAYCWGRNTNGQLGNNSTTNALTPVAIAQGDMPAGATIRDISAGNSYTCAIASDNKAYCWGLNTSNQLGDGTTTQRNSPEAVLQGDMPSGATVRSMRAGAYHTCAIASNNKAYCWGANTNGRLGDGTTTNRSAPEAVIAGAMGSSANIVQIDAGTHTCAIASNNKAYCWGYNASGQLGDGSTTSRSSPVAVVQGDIPSGVGIQQISTSKEGTTCAIATNWRAYCWGENGNRQVGDGLITDRDTPTAVQNLPNFTSSSSGLGRVFYF